MDAVVRTVTVLFNDIVGSTELFGRLGPEASDRLRERLFALVRTAVDGHRGREVKSLGDGSMAVFESASDAVACAVAIQRRLAEDNRRRRDPQVRMRIGVSVGEATLQDGDVFGTPAVEACRLCDAAAGAEILAGELVAVLVGDRGGHDFDPVTEPLTLKGLPAPVRAVQVRWEPASDRPIRVVLADDAVLVREGVARLLEEEGIDVAAQAGDADELLRCVAAVRPDAVITDVRMPPGHELEGLHAAEEIRRRYPGTGVLLLSQHLETEYALRLVAEGAGGVGYLLKERVSDVEEFGDLVRRVAGSGSAIDPEVVGRLLARGGDRLASLDDRDRQLLALAGEGRPNAEIAASTGCSEAEVESRLSEASVRLDIEAPLPPSERAGAILRALAGAGDQVARR